MAFCRLPRKKYESMINYYNINSQASNSREDLLRTLFLLPAHSYTSTDSEEEELDEDDPKLNENKIISGLWGIHRFHNHPWTKRRRPFRRLRHFEKLQLTDKERQGKLSRRMVACCLSYLERSPYDLKYALCKCQMPEKALVDISILRNYHYIQYLDLSHNKITTLEALSEMPYLQYFDASYNCIENAFDFSPPLYLTTVNYSNNKIVNIPCLDAFWSITNLDLSFNCIREIKGLDNLKYLIELNLSHNKIRMIENLNHLRLMKLDLSQNYICLVENNTPKSGFHTIHELFSVNLSHNRLSSLDFLQWNEYLEDIDISDNQINDLLEIYYIRYLNRLKRFNISDNKVCENPHFRTMCIRIIPKLYILNDTEVTPTQKINASTKENISPLIPAHNSRMQLLMLENINKPKIGVYTCPYDYPAPSIMLIVGPPACRKKDTIRMFVEHSEFLKIGITHTNRPKRKSEIEGTDYYYIKRGEFVEMIRQAEFAAVSEYNGHLYGISHKELEKGFNSIVVFCSTLESALILKMAGLNPKIVLAIPREEKKHIAWIKENYFFDEAQNTPLQEITIRPCPTSVRNKDDANESELEDEEDDRSFELGDISSSILGSLKKDEESSQKSDNNEVDSIIFKNIGGSSSSLKSDIISDRVKNSSGVLKPTERKERRPASIRYETPKQILSWKNYPENNYFAELLDPCVSDENKYPQTQNDESREQTKQAPIIQDELPKSELKEDINQSGILKKDTSENRKGNEDNVQELNKIHETQIKNEAEKYTELENKPPVNEIEDETNKRLSFQNEDASSCIESIETEEQESMIYHIPSLGELNKATVEPSKDNAKRVSFNWSKGDDSDVRYFDLDGREQLKSISNSNILRSMQNRFFDNPLLSVLSASILGETPDMNFKTAYTTLAERFDALQTDKLGPFLTFCLELREELLELHYENPGLFQNVIFTDDHPSKSISILKQVAKNIVEIHGMYESKYELYEDNPQFKEYLEKKLKKLDLPYNRYTNLLANMKIA